MKMKQFLLMKIDHKQNPTPSRIDLMPDTDINKLIRSLNEKQSHVFDMITQWSRRYVKNLSAEQTVDNPPLKSVHYRRCWKQESLI